MGNKQAIMFDLYGTLIDIHTDEHTKKFWQRFAKKTACFKKYQPQELKRKYFQLVQELEKKKEEIEILNVFEKLFDANKEEQLFIARQFRKLSTKYIKLYPGVKRLLNKLNQKGFELYVLSNAQKSFTLPELEKLGILKYFKGIAISSEYGIKKPNKEFFLQAMNNFGITKPMMIGNDYWCDIEPAIKLKLKTLFIETNLTPINNVDNKIKGFNCRIIYKNISNIYFQIVV